MKNVTCIVLIIGVLLSQGCAGRNPYPVRVTQPQDHNLTCNQLESELSRILHEANIKAGNQSRDDNKDAALVGVGLLLFWPALFFTDLKNADRVEVVALRRRHAYLSRIYQNKGCP